MNQDLFDSDKVLCSPTEEDIQEAIAIQEHAAYIVEMTRHAWIEDNNGESDETA